MSEKSVAILHIYGARTIFLLFCYHQDTKSESRDIEICVAGPIFPQGKNTKGSIVKWYPYPKIWANNIVAIIHIYGSRANFLLLYDNQDTESVSLEIEIGVYGQISTQKNIKGSMGK